MKEKIQNFIDHLKEKDYLKDDEVYANHEGWQYYFHMAGFIKGHYFCLFFMKHTEEDPHETEVNSTTDRECRKEIKHLLKKFDLL